MELKPIDDPYAFLEDVLSRTRREGVVRLGETELTVSTLSAEEEAEAYMAMSADRTDPRRLVFDKMDTLAYAVKGIGGERFPYDSLGNPADRRRERGRSVAKVRKIIGTWQDSVVEHVFSRMSGLSQGLDEFKLKEIQNG